MREYLRDKKTGYVGLPGDGIARLPGDEPVVVLDRADWERLVELLNIPLLRMLLKKMASELAEIDSIIAKVNEANSHE